MNYIEVRVLIALTEITEEFYKLEQDIPDSSLRFAQAKLNYINKSLNECTCELCVVINTEISEIEFDDEMKNVLASIYFNNLNHGH